MNFIPPYRDSLPERIQIGQIGMGRWANVFLIRMNANRKDRNVDSIIQNIDV